MKSNEEFIAEIYEKAKKQEHRNVVPIHSFQKRIKKYSAVAAGFLTICICGITTFLGRQASTKEEPTNRTMEEKVRTASVLEEQGHYMVCTVNQVKKEKDMVSIHVVKTDGVTAMLEVPVKNYYAQLNKGDEIAIFVSDFDETEIYHILSSSDIFVYSGIENGKKVFTSDNHSVITEDEIFTE